MLDLPAEIRRRVERVADATIVEHGACTYCDESHFLLPQRWTVRPVCNAGRVGASGRLSRLTRVNQTGVLAFRQPEQTGCDEPILARAIQRIPLLRRRSVLPFAVGSNFGL